MAATNTDFVDSAKSLDALDTRTELYGLEQPPTSSPPTSLLERIPGVRALNRWRDERALPNPGTMEGLFREVNSASLSLLSPQLRLRTSVRPRFVVDRWPELTAPQ